MNDICNIYSSGFYEPSMIGAQACLNTLHLLLTHHHPSLVIHLSSIIHLPLPLIILPWFLCLYINILPTETVYRVWDVLFLEQHPPYLLLFSLTLLQFCEDGLLKCTDFDGILTVFSQRLSSLVDADALIDAVYEVAGRAGEKEGIARLIKCQMQVLKLNGLYGWWMMDDGWWMMDDGLWMTDDRWWMMDDGWRGWRGWWDSVW